MESQNHIRHPNMKWRFVDTLQHQAARTSRSCLVAPFLDKDRGLNIGENDANLLLGQLQAYHVSRIAIQRQQD